LLWAVLDGSGPLLLEEPELSLHSAVVRGIAGLFANVQRSSDGRQILVSTHSQDLLDDEGIGLNEVLVLEPGQEGTVVRLAGAFPDVEAMVQGGVPLSDVLGPRTAPGGIEQLALFGSCPVQRFSSVRSKATSTPRSSLGPCMRVELSWDRSTVGVASSAAPADHRFQPGGEIWPMGGACGSGSRRLRTRARAPVASAACDLDRAPRRVRTAEAWLLADRMRMAEFLAVSADILPRDPDSLRDPKGHLVDIARRSTDRAVRAGLVPKDGSGRPDGAAYNPLLLGFIKDRWRPEVAAGRSESLRRSLVAIGRLVSMHE
jgi:hypothetical protein